MLKGSQGDLCGPADKVCAWRLVSERSGVVRAAERRQTSFFLRRSRYPGW